MGVSIGTVIAVDAATGALTVEMSRVFTGWALGPLEVVQGLNAAIGDRVVVSEIDHAPGEHVVIGKL